MPAAFPSQILHHPPEQRCHDISYISFTSSSSMSASSPTGPPRTCRRERGMHEGSGSSHQGSLRHRGSSSPGCPHGPAGGERCPAGRPCCTEPWLPLPTPGLCPALYPQVRCSHVSPSAPWGSSASAPCPALLHLHPAMHWDTCTSPCTTAAAPCCALLGFAGQVGERYRRGSLVF